MPKNINRLWESFGASRGRIDLLLPFTDGLMVTTPFDRECAMLADRHYSRQSHGSRQFSGNGRKLVLRDAVGSILFVWLYPKEEYRMDGQKGYNCTIFRNESSRRSSEIILEAEGWAIRKWGPNRMYTYVDPTKVKSPNPGYCFKVAGWKQVGMSKGGKLLLAKNSGAG